MRQIMSKVCGLVPELILDKRGVTAIEYGLIAAGISIAILATVFALGAELNNMFEVVAAALDECAGSGSASQTGLTQGQGTGCGQQQ